jgi:hypothetical protein
VEGTIHNWIHGAVAASSFFNLPMAEKDIIRQFHSVQSTYFYKIHGLVEYWWNRWLHPKSHIKEIIDHPVKSHIKEIIDQKVHVKEIIDQPGKLHIKEKDKDIIEGDGKQFADIPDPFRPAVDPALIRNLVQRIAKLEGHPEKKSPFIKPLERPNVGEAVVKKKK